MRSLHGLIVYGCMIYRCIDLSIYLSIHACMLRDPLVYFCRLRWGSFPFLHFGHAPVCSTPCCCCCCCFYHRRSGGGGWGREAGGRIFIFVFRTGEKKKERRESIAALFSYPAHQNGQPIASAAARVAFSSSGLQGGKRQTGGREKQSKTCMTMLTDTASSLPSLVASIRYQYHK